MTINEAAESADHSNRQHVPATVIITTESFDTDKVPRLDNVQAYARIELVSHCCPKKESYRSTRVVFVISLALV